MALSSPANEQDKKQIPFVLLLFCVRSLPGACPHKAHGLKAPPCAPRFAVPCFGASVPQEKPGLDYYC